MCEQVHQLGSLGYGCADWASLPLSHSWLKEWAPTAY